jgi:plastocyanin
MRKLSALLSACALAPFALAACGGDDDTTTAVTTGGGGGGGETVAVSADPGGELAFEQTSLTASAGTATFDFTNDSPVQHDFCIEDSSGSEVGCSDTISQSQTSLTEDLQPGKYTFFCSVDAHRESGMEGTLTVK